MNELIVIQPKQIGNEEVNAVDARDLHSQLGVKKDFSDWIKAQITRLNLVENVDYLVFPQKGEYKKPRYEYAVTLDAGKHIAMMAGTDNAHAIRTYFIEFEKKAKSALTNYHNDPIISLRINQIEMESRIGRLENKMDDLTPAMSSASMFSITKRIAQVAKLYRQVKELRRIKISGPEAQNAIRAEVLTHFDANDIAYIKDVNTVYRFLNRREKELVSERDDLFDQMSLFSKKAA